MSVVAEPTQQFCFYMKYISWIKYFRAVKTGSDHLGALFICTTFVYIIQSIMTVKELTTDLSRSVCTAAARCVSRSTATRSPTAARQSSTEVSGTVGLNTSDVCRSKPDVEQAAPHRGEG